MLDLERAPPPAPPLATTSTLVSTSTVCTAGSTLDALARRVLGASTTNNTTGNHSTGNHTTGNHTTHNTGFTRTNPGSNASGGKHTGGSGDLAKAATAAAAAAAAAALNAGSQGARSNGAARTAGFDWASLSTSLGAGGVLQHAADALMPNALMSGRDSSTAQGVGGQGVGSGAERSQFSAGVERSQFSAGVERSSQVSAGVAAGGAGGARLPLVPPGLAQRVLGVANPANPDAQIRRMTTASSIMSTPWQQQKGWGTREPEPGTTPQNL